MIHCFHDSFLQLCYASKTVQIEGISPELTEIRDVVVVSEQGSTSVDVASRRTKPLRDGTATDTKPYGA
jgi:hypothetical protein